MQEKEQVCEDDVYKTIFYEQAEGIRNFIFYKSGNMALAEDVVQDAFSKLWENCSKVSFAKAKSYLFTTANRLFLNKVSHQKVVLKFENTPQKDQNNETPQFLMEEEEFRLRLENAISTLTEEQRIVFLMNRIDKKKYKEIAEELGISVKAVEKRMHKALAVLRKIHKKV